MRSKSIRLRNEKGCATGECGLQKGSDRNTFLGHRWMARLGAELQGHSLLVTPKLWESDMLRMVMRLQNEFRPREDRPNSSARTGLGSDSGTCKRGSKPTIQFARNDL